MENRVDRLGKDIDNGVKKVERAVKDVRDTVKKAASSKDKDSE